VPDSDDLTSFDRTPITETHTAHTPKEISETASVFL
jgi:hypothetical protein